MSMILYAWGPDGTCVLAADQHEYTTDDQDRLTSSRLVDSKVRRVASDLLITAIGSAKTFHSELESLPDRAWSPASLRDHLKDRLEPLPAMERFTAVILGRDGAWPVAHLLSDMPRVPRPARRDELAAYCHVPVLPYWSQEMRPYIGPLYFAHPHLEELHGLLPILKHQGPIEFAREAVQLTAGATDRVMGFSAWVLPPRGEAFRWEP